MQFKQENRLKRSRDFDNVFKRTDVKARKDCFLLLAAKNSLDIPRLGLIVAKKHIKKATGRNTVKRIIRESFRLQLRELPALDIVVLISKPCSDYNRQQLWQFIDDAWQRLLKNAH